MGKNGLQAKKYETKPESIFHRNAKLPKVKQKYTHITIFVYLSFCFRKTADEALVADI